MPQQQQPDIPVFLFTGFLEAGKTRFIKQVALTDPAFRSGEKTLLLLCEEGEVGTKGSHIDRQTLRLSEGRGYALVYILCRA